MGADLVLWLPLTKLGPSYDDSTVTQDILFSKVKKEGLGKGFKYQESCLYKK